MSDIRFNNWLHQSGTGGVYQNSAGNIGIGTTVPRTSLDVVGVVSATSFSGDLTGNVTGNVNASGNSTFDGSVGIGTNTPTQKLEVYGGKIFIDGGGNRKITLDPGSNTTYEPRIDASHSLVFRSYVDAGPGVKTCTFDTNGDLDLTQGRNLKFASGQGIDFSATSDAGGMTSELLDDYEEGTWTPVIKSGTNTITATGNNQVYTYTKVGRKVTVYFAMDGATTSGTTGGHFKIEGLPYAMNGPTGNRTMGSVLMFYGSGLRAANWPVWIHLNWNSSILDIYEKSATANNYDRTTVGQVGASSYVFGQITYDAA